MTNKIITPNFTLWSNMPVVQSLACCVSHCAPTALDQQSQSDNAGTLLFSDSPTLSKCQSNVSGLPALLGQWTSCVRAH